jgi:uncharacterized protein YndB with AHSA1/START domain
MSDDTQHHESFSISRVYAAERAEVWLAWAIRDKKSAWLHCSKLEIDFRVGGSEHASYVAGEDEHVNETRYFEIADQERIVMAYSMAKNGRVHTVSLATVTFADVDGGTRLTYMEQMCIIPPSDGVRGREEGWNSLLNTLEAFLRDDL